jgi:hypothetical protein
MNKHTGNLKAISDDDLNDDDVSYHLPSDSKCSSPEIHLLGEVVFWFGNLELFLEGSMWHLMVPEEDTGRFLMAQAMTAEMSFSVKVKTFDRMFRQRGIACAESELEALVKKLTVAGAERNQLMHSSWNYSPLWGGRDLMRSKLRRNAKDLARGFHRMPAESIEKTRDLIMEASSSLGLFTMKYIQSSEPERT